MSRFNTGNPIDSSDFKDLSDNAKNVDIFSNATNKSSYVDRFGVERRTIHGMGVDFSSAMEDMSQRFNKFLIDSGYVFLGDYTEGLVLEEYNQIVRSKDQNGNDFFWRAGGQTDLPYTLTGDGVDENGALVSIGDMYLRGDVNRLSSEIDNLGVDIEKKWHRGTLDLVPSPVNRLSSIGDDSIGLSNAWFDPAESASYDFYSVSNISNNNLAPRYATASIDIVDNLRNRSSLSRVRRSGSGGLRMPLTGVRTYIDSSPKDLCLFKVGNESLAGGDSFRYLGSKIMQTDVNGSAVFYYPVGSRLSTALENGVYCYISITPTTLGESNVSTSQQVVGVKYLDSNSVKVKLPSEFIYSPESVSSEVESILSRQYLGIDIGLSGQITFEPGRDYFVHIYFKSIDGSPVSYDFNYTVIVDKFDIFFGFDATDHFYNMYKGLNNGY